MAIKTIYEITCENDGITRRYSAYSYLKGYMFIGSSFSECTKDFTAAMANGKTDIYSYAEKERIFYDLPIKISMPLSCESAIEPGRIYIFNNFYLLNTDERSFIWKNGTYVETVRFSLEMYAETVLTLDSKAMTKITKKTFLASWGKLLLLSGEKEGSYTLEIFKNLENELHLLYSIKCTEIYYFISQSKILHLMFQYQSKDVETKMLCLSEEGNELILQPKL